MNKSPPLERLLDPAQCLEPTEFIDSDSASVAALAQRVRGDGPPTQKAVRLFEHVRDEIQYEFRAKHTKDEFRASRVLADGKGFCVQKAVLLCALLRAARIPSALVLCDLKDYTLSHAHRPGDGYRHDVPPRPQRHPPQREVAPGRRQPVPRRRRAKALPSRRVRR
jgi:transglutaminase-like putative cysteine protease